MRSSIRLVVQEKLQKGIFFSIYVLLTEHLNPIPVRKLNTCSHCVLCELDWIQNQVVLILDGSHFHFPDGDFHISLLNPPLFPDYSARLH